jgi:hypothetical protein
MEIPDEISLGRVVEGNSEYKTLYLIYHIQCLYVSIDRRTCDIGNFIYDIQYIRWRRVKLPWRQIIIILLSLTLGNYCLLLLIILCIIFIILT